MDGIVILVRCRLSDEEMDAARKWDACLREDTLCHSLHRRNHEYTWVQLFKDEDALITHLDKRAVFPFYTAFDVYGTISIAAREALARTGCDVTVHATVIGSAPPETPLSSSSCCIS